MTADNAAAVFVDQPIAEGLGDHTALVAPGRRFTYAELGALVDRAGHALRARGVEPEQRVAPSCVTASASRRHFSPRSRSAPSRCRSIHGSPRVTSLSSSETAVPSCSSPTPISARPRRRRWRGWPSARARASTIVFVLPRDPGTARAELEAGVRRLMEASLPRHQWPRGILVVEDLPRTATGKLQRFRLRDHALGTGQE